MNIAKDILVRCCQGDEQACKEVYEMYLPYCCGICNRYGISQTNLKDHVQIIFSSVFKSLENFDANKASFKTWFTHICINKILEQRRKNKHQFLNEELPEFDLNLIQDDTDNLIGGLERAYLLEILNQMPVQLQSVFNMYIIDGYSHKEIASELGISIGNSRAILNRARQWAKKALTNYLKHY